MILKIYVIDDGFSEIKNCPNEEDLKKYEIYMNEESSDEEPKKEEDDLDEEEESLV